MPYGFSDVDWNSGKKEIVGILRQRASARAMITYGDLSGMLKTIKLPYDDPAMGAILGEISTEEALNGHGMLSVIVVHKYGDMGPGFYDCAQKLGYDVSDRLAFWVSELHKVHRYWSNRQMPKPPQP